MGVLDLIAVLLGHIRAAYMIVSESLAQQRGFGQHESSDTRAVEIDVIPFHSPFAAWDDLHRLAGQESVEFVGAFVRVRTAREVEPSTPCVGPRG